MTVARTCLALTLLASCAPPRSLERRTDVKELEPRSPAAPIALNSPAPSGLGPPAASTPTCFRAVVERCYASAAEACRVAGCPDDCHPFVAGGSIVVDCANAAGVPLDSAEQGCVRIAEEHCYSDREAACTAVLCPIDVHRYCAELPADGDATFVYCAHGGW